MGAALPSDIHHARLLVGGAPSARATKRVGSRHGQLGWTLPAL